MTRHVTSHGAPMTHHVTSHGAPMIHHMTPHDIPECIEQCEEEPHESVQDVRVEEISGEERDGKFCGWGDGLKEERFGLEALMSDRTGKVFQEEESQFYVFLCCVCVCVWSVRV